MRNTSVFSRDQDKQIGPKNTKDAVTYKGLAPSRARKCVNTSISAPESGQITAIQSVSGFPRFLEIAKAL